MWAVITNARWYSRTKTVSARSPLVNFSSGTGSLRPFGSFGPAGFFGSFGSTGTNRVPRPRNRF